MNIGTRQIKVGEPCFIVAELSGNHHQRYEEARALVRAAKTAGADAVKLQTYTPDTITLNSDKEWFRVGGADTPKEWRGKTLYELYKESYTPWEWQPKLKKVADRLGILLFSTPFDETAVEFLEDMDVVCYKIASYEVTDFVLLRKVAATTKPVILSIGYASEEEVQYAIDTLHRYGTDEIALLHCVSGYSGEPKLNDMHLRTIADIPKRFGVVGGFSDNNAGIEAPLFAVAAGARIVEKHLILDRSSGGVDARFSIEPDEFKTMVARIREVEKNPASVSVPETVLGAVHYGPATPAEQYNQRWRRSLFITKDMKKGERFSPDTVRSVRPAYGLQTKYYDEIIGKRAAKDLAGATPLSWELVQNHDA